MSLMNLGQGSETRMASKDLLLKSNIAEEVSSSSSEIDCHGMKTKLKIKIEKEKEKETEKETDYSNITTADKKIAGKFSSRNSASSSPKGGGIRLPTAISGAAAYIGKSDYSSTNPPQISSYNLGSDSELRNFETIKPRRESSASSPRLILNHTGEYNPAYLKEALFKLRSAVGEKQGSMSPRVAANEKSRIPSFSDMNDSQLPLLQPSAQSITSAPNGFDIGIQGQSDKIEHTNFLPARYITTSPSISPSNTPPHTYLHQHQMDGSAEADGQLDNLSTNTNSDSLATVPLSSRDEQEPICPALVLQLPPTPADMSRIMAVVGSNLFSVGSIVGHQAADVAVVMGAAVAVQAERVLSSTSEIVPRYSNQDMKKVISRKNVLLGELSESCLQLGIMQDKEKEMASLLQELNTKEAEMQERHLSEHCRANMLESELIGLREDVRNEAKVTEAVRGQLEAIRLELITERYVAESLRATLDEVQPAAAAQTLRLAQICESEQRMKRLLEASREERARDVAAVQCELQQMSIDSMTLREDMRLASEQAVAQITGICVCVDGCMFVCSCACVHSRVIVYVRTPNHHELPQHDKLDRVLDANVYRIRMTNAWHVTK